MNPLNLDQIIAAGQLKSSLTTLPGIANAFVSIILPLAGIVLLIVIILAGFNLLTGANDPKKVDSAKQTLTTAVIGFFIIFAAYWIAQLLEVLTAFPIVSP